eukprot:scaffold25075_cov44-Phaeocystis_antarctica.AAC.2
MTNASSAAVLVLQRVCSEAGNLRNDKSHQGDTRKRKEGNTEKEKKDRRTQRKERTENEKKSACYTRRPGAWLASALHRLPGWRQLGRVEEVRAGSQNARRVVPPVVLLALVVFWRGVSARARRVTPNGERNAPTPYKYSAEGVRPLLVPQKPRRSASEWSNAVRTSACGSKDDTGWLGKRGSHRPPAVPLRC